MNTMLRPRTLAPARSLSARPCAPKRLLIARPLAALPLSDLVNTCPYRTLGVGFDATEEEIRAAYRRKARALHPDVCKSPLSPIAFMECQGAYQTLLDPEKRAKYDRTIVPRAANQQVLSYLNARSAARHGVTPTHLPSRGAPYQNRPELYNTLGTLLQQVKSCAKHLEREVLGSKAAKRSSSPVEIERAVEECIEHGECGAWVFSQALPVEERPAPGRR